MKTISKVYNWIFLVIVLVHCLGFMIGFVPYENPIHKKEFLPQQKALKVLSIIVLCFLVLFIFLAQLGVAMSPCDDSTKWAKNILLTNI